MRRARRKYQPRFTRGFLLAEARVPLIRPEILETSDPQIN
jgi:hypothetical protein